MWSIDRNAMIIGSYHHDDRVEGMSDKPLRQVIADHARPPTKPTRKPFYEQLVKSGAIAIGICKLFYMARECKVYKLVCLCTQSHRLKMGSKEHLFRNNVHTLQCSGGRQEPELAGRACPKRIPRRKARNYEINF